jgi:hypothetical protein
VRPKQDDPVRAAGRLLASSQISSELDDVFRIFAAMHGQDKPGEHMYRRFEICCHYLHRKLQSPVVQNYSQTSTATYI